MKEKMLVLAKTKAEPSVKYGATVCVAGMLENGDLRRIYPLPHLDYLNNKFGKRDWIEYKIKEDDYEDNRKESKKIHPGSIKILDKEPYDTFYPILRRNLTTIEDLRDNYKKDKTSLGIVKVKDLNSFKCEIEPLRKYSPDLCIDPLDVKGKYSWNCNHPECNGHQTIILDSEFISLYSNLKRMGLDPSHIFVKLHEKFFSWMKNREVYFMMGTHYIHRKSWMIISIFYPKYLGETLDTFSSHPTILRVA
jgi:hypothetical protein